ncbi:MAG: hypothetical protein ACRD50_16630 [Candidatus Acidiferrales bacterium]
MQSAGSGSACYSGSTSTTTTQTCQFASNTAGGNLYVIFARWGSGTATASLSDTEGNSFSSTSGAVNIFTDGTSSQLFYAQNVAGGTKDTITVTISASVLRIELMIFEYSGVASSSALDAHKEVTQASSSSSCASASVTTSANNDLIVGACNLTNSPDSPTFTATSGFTLRLSGVREGEEDRISAAGTYTSSMALSSSHHSITHVAAFFAAAGGPAPKHPLPLLGVGL